LWEEYRFLSRDQLVMAYCLKLTGLPDLNTPEDKDMRAYYQAWFKYNSTFLDFVRKDQAAFIDWVAQP
jgi:hypothetical protein